MLRQRLHQNLRRLVEPLVFDPLRHISCAILVDRCPVALLSRVPNVRRRNTSSVVEIAATVQDLNLVGPLDIETFF